MMGRLEIRDAVQQDRKAELVSQAPSPSRQHGEMIAPELLHKNNSAELKRLFFPGEKRPVSSAKANHILPIT